MSWVLYSWVVNAVFLDNLIRLLEVGKDLGKNLKDYIAAEESVLEILKR